MSILDTFYVLFKTDADKAAAEIKNVDKAADGAEKNLNKMDQAAGKLGASFVSMARSLVAPLAALVSFGSLTSIAIDRAREIRDLDAFSAKLNSSISDVDAFQRSVKEFGGDTAGAVDSLTKIGEKLNEAFSDKESGARKDFKEWGLVFKNTKGQALGASEGMLALAANLEKVSNAEALARLKKLGIEDPATIEMLLMGRRTMEAYIESQKEMGVVTEDQAFAVREYYGELGRANNVLTSVGNSITALVLPAVTASVRAFANAVSWLTKHSKLVEGFFVGVSIAVTTYFLPAMTRAAIAVIAATWPFIAMGTAIAAIGAAFALAYEDVAAFMDGQPSLIGELVKKYQWFADIVRGIGAVFARVDEVGKEALGRMAVAWDIITKAAEIYTETQIRFWSTFKPIWEAVKEIFSAIAGLIEAMVGRATVDLNKLVEAWTGRFNELPAIARQTFEEMLASIGLTVGDITAFADVIKDAFVSAFGYIRSAWDSTIGAIAAGISGAAAAIRTLTGSVETGGQPADTAGAAAAGARMGAMITTGQTQLGSGATASAARLAGAAPGTTNVDQSTSVQTGGITINTQAVDAKGIARDIKSSLQNEYRSTSSSFDNGVDR